MLAAMAMNRDWMTDPCMRFALATLSPVPFLVLGAVFGGVFSLIAVVWVLALGFLADAVIARLAALRGRSPAKPGPCGAADPAALRRADLLSVGLAGLHFVLLAIALTALSGATGLGFFSWILTFLGFGLWFGQVSNSNAHELIHRSDRRLHLIGMWVFISLLFGHHTSAHRLVHHRFVATPDDPNTAEKGESFYAFAARAWPGAFVAGLEMESALRRGKPAWRARLENPYLVYLAGAAGCVVLVGAIFGLDGLVAYLLLAGYAQLQLLLSDYVQHYGLLRRPLPDGGYEPVGPRHSWDAPHPLSALMMLNAPRHADHHAHPSRPYPDLVLSPGSQAPLLPWPLPVMATIALWPKLWRQVMAPRLADLARRSPRPVARPAVVAGTDRARARR